MVEITQAADTRFAAAIFCDDIRFELGNKATLVGLYNADMYVAELPTFIAKLCVWVSVTTPAGQPFRTLKVRIERGKDVLTEAAPPIGDMNFERTSAPTHDAQTRATMVVYFNLPPMTIAEPCTFRAIAVADDVEYVAGKLHVGLFPSQEAK